MRYIIPCILLLFPFSVFANICLVPVQTVPEIIKQEANKQGVSPNTMIGIAKAESGLNPKAKNPHSTATGLFQIITSTWNYFGCTGERIDPRDNARCAADIASESGLHHWNASRHNWSP